MARFDVAERFGREVRVTRTALGLSQSQVARRAGVSQPTISKVERGRASPDLRCMARIAAGLGHQLSIRLYPTDGIRLRDSGQLGIAEIIRSEAHRSWGVNLEVPVAGPPDRRAADMVLLSAAGIIHVEIERGLRDFQAQLRAAQLKRLALAERYGRQVRLLIAVPDTVAARQAVAPHSTIIQASLPITSRAAWAAVRSGVNPPGDALLWVRRR